MLPGIGLQLVNTIGSAFGLLAHFGQKLDDMIKAFEEGRKLVTDCQRELESVKLRIEKVTREGETEELKL